MYEQLFGFVVCYVFQFVVGCVLGYVICNIVLIIVVQGVDDFIDEFGFVWQQGY